jgi:hypothetical protein
MKTRKSMTDLMAAATPATIEPVAVPAPKTKAAKPAGPVEQQQLVVQLPAVTVRALKQQALDEGSTIRAVVLAALAGAGVPVPAGQVVDFRKVKRP